MARLIGLEPRTVGLHHPPYSIDSHHGGSQAMGAALDQAFNESGRVPDGSDAVITPHVDTF